MRMRTSTTSARMLTSAAPETTTKFRTSDPLMSTGTLNVLPSLSSDAVPWRGVGFDVDEGAKFEGMGFIVATHSAVVWLYGGDFPFARGSDVVSGGLPGLEGRRPRIGFETAEALGGF